MPHRHQLQLSTTADAAAPLTPEQKRFNTLIGQIAEQRRLLAAWQAHIPLYQQAHVKRLEPLLEQLRIARRELVFVLDGLLDHPGWSRADARTLADVLLERLQPLIDAAGSDPDPALRALYDKHAEVDFEAERHGSRLAMKEMFETMTGADLGESDGIESDEALMARIHQAFSDRQAAEEAAAEKRATDKPRRQSAAEKRRETEAQQATQSVREVYRKLASALHPDREPDVAQREAKTVLMQRVNSAYAASDLLTLLELQLEIEQIDARHLQGATPARLKQYNKLLSGQLVELKAEIEQVQMKFEMDFGLQLDRKLNPDKLDRLIDRGYQELSAVLAEEHRERRMLVDRTTTRQWLKIVRRELRERDDGDGFFY